MKIERDQYELVFMKAVKEVSSVFTEDVILVNKDVLCKWPEIDEELDTVWFKCQRGCCSFMDFLSAVNNWKARYLNLIPLYSPLKQESLL